MQTAKFGQVEDSDASEILLAENVQKFRELQKKNDEGSIDRSVLGVLKKPDQSQLSCSDDDSDLESCLIDKIGLLIEKKFGNIVIQGGDRPKKITRTDQVLNYSLILLE